MKVIKIYLAGKMSGLSFAEMNTWRTELEFCLKLYAEKTGVVVEVINPVSYYNFGVKRHQSELEVMKFDLAKVKSSNIIIVNMKGLNTSIGTCIEIYEAYKQEIPILAFGKKEEFNNLHPWIQNCITRHDENYSEIIDYIRDFYFT